MLRPSHREGSLTHYFVLNKRLTLLSMTRDHLQATSRTFCDVITLWPAITIYFLLPRSWPPLSKAGELSRGEVVMNIMVCVGADGHPRMGFGY